MKVYLILAFMTLWAAAQAGPIVNLSYSNVGFGHVTVGKKSSPLPIKLTNVGDATLFVNSITLSGTNAGDFTQTNNCGSSVLKGENCTISVTFAPSAAGPRTALLSVYDSAIGSPQGLSLKVT